MSNYSADESRLLALVMSDTGDAPCSRYGTRPESFAPFAVATATVLQHFNGESYETSEDLDGLMSEVVNDSPAPADRIVEGWHALTPALRRDLGGKSAVRKLTR